MLKRSMTVSGFLSAALFTWGIAGLLYKLYAVEFSPVPALMICLSVLLVIFLIFYNTTTAVIFFASAGAALAAFLYVLLRGHTEIGKALGEAVGAFAYEAYAFFAFEGGTAFFENHSILVAVIFCIIPALPSLFLFGRFRGAFILGLAAGVFFVVEFWYGVVNFYPELCAVACSVVAVSAGSFARQRQAEIRQAGSTGSLIPAGKRRVAGVQVGGRVAAVVLILSLPVVAAISLMLPRNVYGLQNVAFETIVDDVVDITGLSTGYGRGRTAFSLSDYGYNARLGGPVRLSKDPVFSISASVPILLRASAKDVYTGYAWERSPDVGEYRFDSGLAADEWAKTFSEGLPTAFGTEEKDSRFSGGAQMAITLLGPDWRSELLTSGRPISLATENIDPFIPYFDTMGDLFSKRLLVQGHSYAVYEERLDFAGPYFADAVVEYEGLVRADKEAGLVPDPYYDEVVSLYSSLPDVLDQKIYDYAEEAVGGIESPYMKVLALREIIARRSVYTLYPSHVPQDQEFVDWFLRTGNGYCTYYATALAVMARTIGIPARYVEGFSTFGLASEEDGSYSITGEQAHAWCEIYLEGIGWIPVDATIEYAQTGDGGSEPAFPGGEGGDSIPRDMEELWEEYMDGYGGIYDPDGAGLARWNIPAGVYRAMVVLLIFAPAFAFFVAIQLMRRPLDLSWMKKKMGAEETMLRYWRDILKMLPYFGVKPVVGETPGRLAERLGILFDHKGKIILFASNEFPEIAGAVEDCVYGSIPPGETALQKINSICRILDRALMRQLQPFRYYLTKRKWKENKENYERPFVFIK